MNIELLPCTDEDYDFCFEVKKAAMRPHIETRWGWDETVQESIHREHWSNRPWSLIILDEEKIGTLSVYGQKADTIRFGEFYLLPAWQRKGIGSQILGDFLADCDTRGLTVELEYLKWNPVGSLYKRHGFVPYGENKIHYFLRRKPARI